MAYDEYTGAVHPRVLFSKTTSLSESHTCLEIMSQLNLCYRFRYANGELLYRFPCLMPDASLPLPTLNPAFVCYGIAYRSEPLPTGNYTVPFPSVLFFKLQTLLVKEFEVPPLNQRMARYECIVSQGEEFCYARLEEKHDVFTVFVHTEGETFLERVKKVINGMTST